MDTSNTTRAPVLNAWKLGQERFAKWTSATAETKAASRLKAEKIVVDTRALLLQTFGCLASVAAALGLKVSSIDERVNTSGRILESLLKPEVVQARLKAKRAGFLARRPGYAFATEDRAGVCSG